MYRIHYLKLAKIRCYCFHRLDI